jgi:hypothetical protein
VTYTAVASAESDATVKQSGELTGSRNWMSKRGSPEFRRVIWLAAVCFNPELSAFYEARRQESKHPMVATVALVHLICSVWIRNQPYDPDYKWGPAGSVIKVQICFLLLAVHNTSMIRCVEHLSTKLR